MATNNTCSTNNSIPVPTELIPYQDWAYVEVIRDYHKHLGDKSSKSKIALLNEIIKPFRKQKGDDLAALRYMTLALYMGDIMTAGCMRALEVVRNHKLNAQVTEHTPMTKEPPKSCGADDGNLNRSKAEKGTKSCKKASMQIDGASVSAKNQSAVDAFVEAIYGGRKKFDELLNDFFGFDINEAKGMSASEFGDYYIRCKKSGWRHAKKA